jgi:hypothetical protein
MLEVVYYVLADDVANDPGPDQEVLSTRTWSFSKTTKWWSGAGYGAIEIVHRL